LKKIQNDNKDLLELKEEIRKKITGQFDKEKTKISQKEKEVF